MSTGDLCVCSPVPWPINLGFWPPQIPLEPSLRELQWFPCPWLGTDTVRSYGISFKPGCYQACIQQMLSVIMVFLLLELILKMLQHGQEFAKCALRLGEVVILMAHSPVVALPCCGLSHPHRHTISDGQGHSKCN